MSSQNSPRYAKDYRRSPSPYRRRERSRSPHYKRSRTEYENSRNYSPRNSRGGGHGRRDPRSVHYNRDYNRGGGGRVGKRPLPTIYWKKRVFELESDVKYWKNKYYEMERRTRGEDTQKEDQPRSPVYRNDDREREQFRSPSPFLRENEKDDE